MTADTGALAALGRRMARGAGWVVALRMAVRLLGLVSTIILARLLEPADFGLIALATVLAASVELLGAFNFDVWLIRHTAPQRSHYDTVWTLSVLRGVFTCAALIALAGPVAAFFDEPRLQVVLAVLGAGVAVSSLENVGIVDFRKHLQMHKDFAFLFGCKVGSFVVTVTLAFVLRSYWALVAGILANHALRLGLSYLMHPHRPRVNLAHWLDVVHFSKWLLAANLMGFAYKRADTFILGKLMSSQALGLYTVAHEIANLAATELVQPIRRVMLPGYSKMLDDLPALRRGFVDGLAIIALLGIPGAAGIGLCADPLVRALLGEKWLEAIPLIQVLALFAIASVAQANQGPVLMALGRTRLHAWLVALGTVALVPAFIWGSVNHGLAGGAWALGLTHTALFLVGLGATLRVLEVRLATVVRQVWRVALATVAMVACVLAVGDAVAGTALWPIAELAVCVLSGAVSYLGVVWLLWRLFAGGGGPERAVLEFLRAPRAAPGGGTP